MKRVKTHVTLKFLLAKEIIARFHSEADADAAEQEFVNRFAKNQVPDDMPEFEFEAGLPIANVLERSGSSKLNL